MKNSIDPIGNRTLDLPGRSAVPQPTACPRIRKLSDAGFESEKLELVKIGLRGDCLVKYVYCILGMKIHNF